MAFCMPVKGSSWQGSTEAFTLVEWDADMASMLVMCQKRGLKLSAI